MSLIDFDMLELLYVRRTISSRLESLHRTLEKNRRYFRDSDDMLLWQQKMGSLEAEIQCLNNARERINIQIARSSFLQNDVQRD